MPAFRDSSIRELSPSDYKNSNQTLNKMNSYFLGGNDPNADQIKSHRFFRNLDWKKLSNKEIPAPLKPKLRNELDTSNFSDEFTKQLPTVSPSPAPANHERLFRGKTK